MVPVVEETVEVDCVEVSRVVLGSVVVEMVGELVDVDCAVDNC